MRRLFLLATILWSTSQLKAYRDWSTFGLSERCLELRGKLATIQAELKLRLDQILQEIGAHEALAELNCVPVAAEDPRIAMDRCAKSKEEFTRRKAELNAEIGQIARTKANSEFLVQEECAKRVY